MYNKIIIAIAVIALGIIAGWYVVGGKNGVPQFPKNSLNLSATPIPKPTSDTSNLYQYREQTSQITPIPTGSIITKGGQVESNITPTITSKSNNGIQVRVTVTYTDGGFTPGVITVKSGTTVIFSNTASKALWVQTSNQSLSGFDEGKSILNGGSFEYTFMKIGTWKYINHNTPTESGIVIVTQ